VAAIRALKAGESRGDVATFVELIDHGDGVGAEGAIGFAVDGFILGEEWDPGVVGDLTPSIQMWLRDLASPLGAAGYCQSGEARGRRGR
jgi:hypothetical protein